MVNKSVAEMGKLYPDDLGEKIITRNDIDFVILIKERKEWKYKIIIINNILCQVLNSIFFCVPILLYKELNEFEESSSQCDVKITQTFLLLQNMQPVLYCRQNFPLYFALHDKWSIGSIKYQISESSCYD